MQAGTGWHSGLDNMAAQSLVKLDPVEAALGDMDDYLVSLVVASFVHQGASIPTCYTLSYYVSILVLNFKVHMLPPDCPL